jgi:hypothetical protein
MARDSEGAGGKMYVFLAMNSLRMSFWTVPLTSDFGTLVSPATAAYIEKSMGAVALMVMEVLTFPRSIPLKISRMSSRALTATPTLPISPRDRGLSESSPS